MLLHLLIISYIGLAFLAILLYTVLTDHKDTICNKKIRVVVKSAIIFFVSLPLIISCCLQIINTVYLSDPVIEITEVTEVYKGYDRNGNELYYIKEAKSSDLKIIDINKVCKGDSDYIIKCEYTNMSDGIASFTGYKRVTYDLVVTNPNKFKTEP